MAPRSAGRRNKIELPDDIWGQVDRQAEGVDMSTSTFGRAVLIGALAKGTAVSLAMHAIDNGLTEPPKRRPRIRLGWESDGENWHFEEWALVRIGTRTKADRFRKPGEGWFLYGPGFDPPLELKTMVQQTAADKATDLLIQHKLIDIKS